MTSLKIGTAILLALVVRSPAFPGESGSVCIAPVPEKPTQTFVPPGFPCDAAKLSVKIDEQPPIAWPVKDNVKIGDLDVTAAHRVVVSCKGKPQQSFRFRFADFKTRKLCLFINDLYKTAQLWESQGTPWCKCQ
jgi:hypothetical protein